MNFNITRNFPFKNKKVLPIIDFRLSVKADTVYAYISESTKDGLVILTNSDRFYTETTYGDIYDQHGVIRGMLVYAYNPPYELTFSQDDGELDESVLYRESIDGVRDIYIKHLNGTYERLPDTFGITTENLNVELDSSSIIFNCYEEEDQYIYLKQLDVDGVKTEGSHNVIFGRNIIKINGDEFGTTVSDPNLLCPTIFTPGSIGATGDPGQAGIDGKDGENVIEYFFNLYECINPCDCFVTSDCLNPNDTLDSCVVEPYDLELEFPIEGNPDECSVCDTSDSDTGDPFVISENDCRLVGYTNKKILEEVLFVEPTISPLSKISDGDFHYDYWDDDIGEAVMKFKITPAIPDGTEFILKFMDVEADGDSFSFCCINTFTSSSQFPYEEGYAYVLKPSKNCVNPFDYYVDENNKPITFYSTWAIDGVSPLTKELYVLYENGNTKQIGFEADSVTYPVYEMRDWVYGFKVFSHGADPVWTTDDGVKLERTVRVGGYKWTISNIDGDKVFELLNTLASDGSGLYEYVDEENGNEYTAILFTTAYTSEYTTNWTVHVLFPESLNSIGPIIYTQPRLFRNGVVHGRDPYYVSGEEFSLICGTHTHIPIYINSTLDSEHRFITPFEGPTKLINLGESSIKVYDAVYGYSKGIYCLDEDTFHEFQKWQNMEGLSDEWSNPMVYITASENPNKLIWNLLKTESLISTTEPTTMKDSVIIKANKTCMIPGGCVFFYLQERIGDTTIDRIHRGFIGTIPFDNTHANLYMLVGDGSENYPNYLETYADTEDVRTYTEYALGSVNYYNILSSEWSVNSNLLIDNDLETPSEAHKIKVWNSNIYTNETSDLFTIIQKCMAYGTTFALTNETTLCKILARVPGSWDASKNSLYSPNFDYHNISSYAWNDDTEPENNRGKNLQYIQETPFICTPTVVTRMVRKGYEAFALNKWSIQATAYVGQYESFSNLYNNPTTIYIKLTNGAGFSIDDSATSVSVTLDLYSYGEKTITIPISGSTVPDSPYRTEDDSVDHSKYSHEEAYYGKVYYNGKRGASIWLDLYDFGYGIPASYTLWSKFRNNATTITVVQTDPDITIIDAVHPTIGSGSLQNRRSRFCVCGAPEYTFMNLSTSPNYRSDFPEGFLMFYATVGKPVSLIDDELTVDSAIVYYQNNDTTGVYADRTGGSTNLLEYNFVGIDRTWHTTKDNGTVDKKKNYVYTVSARLNTPDKDTFVTAGADLPSDTNPEWEASPYLKISLNSGGSITDSFETFYTDEINTNHWSHRKEAGTFNYDPTTGTESAKVTYKQAFFPDIDLRMIASFNDEATYTLASAYPIPAEPAYPAYIPIVFNIASPTTQYEDYYSTGGRIYFNVQASNWVIRRKDLPDATPSRVSRASFPYCSAVGINLYEIWRTKIRYCIGYTLYYLI